MVNRLVGSSIDCAPPTSYQLLTATEFKGRLSEMAREGRGTYSLIDPLFFSSTSTKSPVSPDYPAFQLDPRLNRSTFSKLRQLYRASETSERYLWDFLRTVHKHLGSTTGIDFLLGFYTPDIASFSDSEREEHFLDLAMEEIWRLRQ